MFPRPAITISTTDFQRLSTLLEHHPDNEVADGLREELDRATLLEQAHMPPDVVTMNARARFRNEGSGHEYTIELVYPHEARGDPGRLSILTPAGAALLGLSAGDEIEWPMAGRQVRLRLMEVPAGAGARA
ncbi:MAG: transcription elongation factor GreAB [Moraxellaceae bacterium]|jgi:regulator of nucleoside diphosphate kinase|nr:transcription elongation factor GreAB [Moraxellaceae bacterium]